MSQQEDQNRRSDSPGRRVEDLAVDNAKKLHQLLEMQQTIIHELTARNNMFQRLLEAKIEMGEGEEND